MITNLTLAGANTSTGSGIFSKGVYKYNNGWTWTKAAEGSADVTFSTSTSYTVTDKSITGETSVEEWDRLFMSFRRHLIAESNSLSLYSCRNTMELTGKSGFRSNID